MNSIVFSKNSLGLAPKIFNSIDMIFPFGKVCSMIDSMMLEISRVKGIAGAAAVGVDNTVRLDFPCNYRHQGA